MTLGSLFHRLDARWRAACVAWVHWRHRRNNLESYQAIDRIVDQYRSGGGLRHPYQAYKLHELSRALLELRPRHILELGTGSTTAVLANYVRTVAGTHLTMVDQSADWLEHARVLAGIGADDPRFEGIVANVVENDSPQSPSVSYDIHLLGNFDLVLVDGPSLVIGGKKNKRAVNTNVLDLVAASPPRAIFVDVRKATVESLVDRFGGLYEVSKSAILTQQEKYGYTYFTKLLLRGKAK